jgi:hypothetical protein
MSGLPQRHENETAILGALAAAQEGRRQNADRPGHHAAQAGQGNQRLVKAFTICEQILKRASACS